MESSYILYELLEMEKLVNHYDREYMKMAMLKHEETFRQQVCKNDHPALNYFLVIFYFSDLARAQFLMTTPLVKIF